MYAFFPEPEVFPWSVRFFNLISSIPNDDNLQSIYEPEHKQYLDSKALEWESSLRYYKLRVSLQLLWEGEVLMKGITRDPGDNTGLLSLEQFQHLSLDWSSVYLVVQGHRLVWWLKSSDIDECKVRMLSMY